MDLEEPKDGGRRRSSHRDEEDGYDDVVESPKRQRPRTGSDGDDDVFGLPDSADVRATPRSQRRTESFFEDKKQEMNLLFGMKKWKVRARVAFTTCCHTVRTSVCAAFSGPSHHAHTMWAYRDLMTISSGDKNLFQGHIAKRPLSERSDVVRELYKSPTTYTPPSASSGEKHVNVGNVAYCILFGWWVSSVYFLVGGLLWLSMVGKPYTLFCWDLATYFFWPFGKYVVKRQGSMNSVRSSALCAPIED